MYVLAIELMLGCQALDFKKGKKPGLGVFVAYKLIRETVPYIKKDSIMYPMVKEIFELIKSEKIVQTVENSIGKLEEPKDLLKPL